MGIFSMTKKKQNQNKQYQEGIDFSFLDYTGIDGEEITAIQILSGEYKDIIYNYGKVSIDKREEPPRLQFDYRIIECGKYTEKDLISNQNYHTMMGDILVSILIEQLGEVDGKNRTDNSEEFDTQ